jgi:hypothetical protein
MAEIRYGYMVVCYNYNKVVVQSVFTNHTENEVYEIATKAFVPNYHHVEIYKVGEITNES